MFDGLSTELLGAAIYDLGRSVLNRLTQNEWVQSFLSKYDLKGAQHDFATRYLEALVELRLQEKPVVVLNFFREQSISRTFYTFYYGEEGSRGNEAQLQTELEHWVAALKVGEELQNVQLDLLEEAQSFWQIFRQKVQESRSIREVEVWDLVLKLKEEGKQTKEIIKSLQTWMEKNQLQEIWFAKSIYNIKEIENAEFRTIIDNKIIINDIDTIEKSVDGWWQKRNKQELFILFICETIESIKSDPNLSSIINYYGTKHWEWKPFGEETILEIIQEYETESGFCVKGFVFCNKVTEDNIFNVRFEDICLPNVIVVTDGLGLSEVSNSYASILDFIKNIGGLVVLLGEDVDKKTRDYIKSRWSNVLKRMYIRGKLIPSIPYPNIDIGNCREKSDFFRMLTIMAHQLGVKSPNLKPVFASLVDDNKSLNSLTPDGNEK